MDGVALDWLGTAITAGVTGLFGYLFGVRKERSTERRARQALAATELVPPLRELQRLLRWFGREHIGKDEVAQAFREWATVFERHGHRLPRGWQHVDRSVRAAAGTVFGGVFLVHLRPDISGMDLGEPDVVWQDYGDDYIGFVATRILRWGDSVPKAPKILTDYDTWLVQTGRRKPYGQNDPSLDHPLQSGTASPGVP